MCQNNSFVFKNEKIFVNGILATPDEAFKMAASYNRSDIMAIIINRVNNLISIGTVYEAFNLAAEYGHLSILQDFIESGDGNLYNATEAIILAEKNGHSEVTKYLRAYSDYVDREYGDAIRFLVLSGQV